MTDAFKKVLPNQPLRVAAEAYNAFVDAARFVRERRHDVDQGVARDFRQSGIVKVRNNTATPRDRFDILGLVEPIILPVDNPSEFKRRVTFDGVVPTLPTHVARFAILQEPLAGGAIGPAVVAGVSIGRVFVAEGEEGFAFAEAAHGVANTLRAREAGSAQILWREPGIGVKWAVVRIGNADDEQRIVHFELTATLDLAGSAEAKALTWDGTDWVPTNQLLEVHDWYAGPGMWQGNAGYRGVALLRPDNSPHGDVLWMETPARSIEFLLAEDMGETQAGRAAAQVSDYYLQGKQPPDEVDVFDAQGNYPRALEGAQGKARWNDRLRRYEIVECNQMAILLTAVLQSALCPGDERGFFQANSFTVLTFPPFGQTPDPWPASALNYYDVAGQAGDICLLAWDEDLNEWAVAQVKHKPQTLLTNLRYRHDESGCAIEVKRRNLAVMACGDESDWQVAIPLHEVTYLEGLRMVDAPSSGSSSGAHACVLQTARAKVCSFAEPESLGYQNAIEFKPQEILIDVFEVNCTLYGTVTTVYTPCLAQPELVTLEECLRAYCCDCSSGGSGSGSSGSGTSGSGGCDCGSGSQCHDPADPFGPPAESFIIEEPEDESFAELSGLAASLGNVGVLWMHNDGPTDKLFAISDQGRYLGTFTLGTTCVDVEDIAIGPGPIGATNYLYVADIGDNGAQRGPGGVGHQAQIRVFRAVEPAVDSNQTPPAEPVALSDVDTILLEYPDGPRDAETLLVDPLTADIYLVTKREPRARVYKAASPQSTSGTNVLTFVGETTWGQAAPGAAGPDGAAYSAVGGSFSFDGEEAILRSYGRLYYYRRRATEDRGAMLTRAPDAEIPYRIELKGEAVTFDRTGSALYTVSERLAGQPTALPISISRRNAP